MIKPDIPDHFRFEYGSGAGPEATDEKAMHDLLRDYNIVQIVQYIVAIRLRSMIPSLTKEEANEISRRVCTLTASFHAHAKSTPSQAIQASTINNLITSGMSKEQIEYLKRLAETNFDRLDAATKEAIDEELNEMGE